MDVDIDAARSDVVNLFPQATRASRLDRGQLVPHNVGIYFQNIPRDPVTGLAAMDYETAEEKGFTKVDVLPLHILQAVKDQEELLILAHREPDWNLLLDPDIQKRLFQVSKHGDLINKIKPRSIIEVADLIALIRPAKLYLLDAYIKARDKVRPELYKKPEDGRNYFKKGHAVAYSYYIIVQLNLISMGRL